MASSLKPTDPEPTESIPVDDNALEEEGLPYDDERGPNDEQQNEAVDVNHHWITMIMGDKLHLATIGDYPERILDIGTGTGVWAIDMSDKCPSASIIGTNISPIQPSWVPRK
ncbi:UMTA protein [Zalerion maritima]|uniref:UMTA protein n=1 Tax=Zalerion maritima TaxID=339359 RepID=A0AAD5WP40_9PEZI|nr:UMTA protein [Zalerion maritima]